MIPLNLKSRIRLVDVLAIWDELHKKKEITYCDFERAVQKVVLIDCGWDWFKTGTAIEDINKPPEEEVEISPEAEKLLAEMRKNFHENRERYRVKSFETLCKKLAEKWRGR